jgi:hypothetical protein
MPPRPPRAPSGAPRDSPYLFEGGMMPANPASYGQNPRIHRHLFANQIKRFSEIRAGMLPILSTWPKT